MHGIFGYALRRNEHDLGLGALPKQILCVSVSHVHAKKMPINGNQAEFKFGAAFYPKKCNAAFMSLLSKTAT